MAVKRGRAGRKSAVGRRRPTPSAPHVQDDASRVYQEMLSEAAASSSTPLEEQRPKKKRRTSPNDSVSQNEEASAADGQLQTILDDSTASDASDVDWEQVDFDQDASNGKPSAADDAASKDVSIDLDRNGETPAKRTASRRLPASTVEKKKRLQIHQIHLCCLLAHVYSRNSWCNDDDIQAVLRPLLNERTVSYLNPKNSLSQFQRSRSFTDGLEQACEAFRLEFETFGRGLKRPSWFNSAAESNQRRITDESEEPTDKSDFLRHAQDLKGSRDSGAQLFCALLRSVGVDARLVCSLQPLSFAAPVPVATRVAMDSKPTVAIEGLDSDQSTAEASGSDTSPPSGVRIAKDSANALKPIKRLGAGGSSLKELGVPPPSTIKRRKIVESSYPVYWVEAFNTALQKWLPVDPLVTKTIAKPHKLEPPASDSLNQLSYVVAFEDDGTAKDVTRRYAKAYNAKTRRSRVEATREGKSWWRKTMKVFDTGFEADRDQVEDAELARKEASEPMPRNMQDFRDHPYYALERHLRRHEVIHPKKEIGKLSGSKATDTTEPIYRRRDVQAVKSADKWYRAGREIKAGEQPLKHSSSSRRQRQRSPSPSSNLDQDESNDFVGLYAEFQTSFHIPPAIVDGRVPKNAYGNLDVYVASMIPPGGVHVRALEAAKAARVVGVDYSDAVTGFKFKGRQGTAIMDGIVVAREYLSAVQETVLAMRWQNELAEREKKGKLALGLWKRYLVGLRIRERVMKYEGDDKNGMEEQPLREQVDEAISKEAEMEAEGGFLPDRGLEAIAEPPGGRMDVASEDFDRVGAEPAIGLNELDGKPYFGFDDRIICIPSPWDKGSARRDTAAVSQEAQEVDESRSSTIGRQSSPKDTIMADVDSSGGGGFLLPTTEEGGGFMIPDGGGGFVVPEQDNRGFPSFVEAPPSQRRTQNESETEDMKMLESNPLEVPASSEPPVRDGDRPTLTDDAFEETAVVSAKASETYAIADAGDAASDVKAEPRRNSNNTSNNAEDRTEREMSKVRSDEESLMSHDPDDEDAEPDWLAEDVRL